MFLKLCHGISYNRKYTYLIIHFVTNFMKLFRFLMQGLLITKYITRAIV